MNLHLVRRKKYTLQIGNKKKEWKKSEITVYTTIYPSWNHLYIFLSLDTKMIDSKKRKLNSYEIYQVLFLRTNPHFMSFLCSILRRIVLTVTHCEVFFVSLSCCQIFVMLFGILSLGLVDFLFSSLPPPITSRNVKIMLTLKAYHAWGKVEKSECCNVFKYTILVSLYKEIGTETTVMKNKINNNISIYDGTCIIVKLCFRNC